ncbi:ABC transporter permease [Vibrio sp. V27_P1S3P104]|uniref:ABC transporter permease n=1 Tax=Vibrio TaxID=662 RepID=UPI000C165300|nr:MULTISPECIES: ABC transporter permease [Vibrio]NAW68497.1 ABC transporter permease [Vibrio sp. V28_P6S34P95]NAX05187.1 ABC transporter permease [Vibrio sp. V30_P3S12P165]NAX33727.1 ABC transporter permease [Vibrio sp. V29_P1S30P107]NAX36980.1 ABC transporter permease [Vibrio sp. V27_P1S3P104]NAX40817.1 ABC transporter permease [Vibrio sp. V26_P1S5P106]
MTLFKLLKAELKALLTNPVVMLTMLGGVVFYSFLYPLPYSQQTPRELPITVVNLDKSQTSYQLERMVDATPQVRIVQRDPSIEDAKLAFLHGDVSGILVIPEHFYKDLLLGKSPTLAYAGDAAYFLVYGTIVEGLAQAGGTLAAKVKISRLIVEGEPLSIALDHVFSLKSNQKPAFNPRMGYIDYVVPAVFVLILHQTLIMAVGLLVGTQKQGNGYWSRVSPLRLILIRSLLFSACYYLLSLYYFGASFSRLGVNTLAQPIDLLCLLFPFLLSASFIGIWLGALTPRRELVTVIVLFSSLPLVFSAGFIWPIEALPKPITWLANLFPSTPGIQGFLALNQMGAEWRQIAPQWTLLCLQTLGWGCLAWWQFKRTGKGSLVHRD